MVTKMFLMFLISRFQAMDELLHMVEKPPSNLLEDLEEEKMGKLQKVRIVYSLEGIRKSCCAAVIDCFKRGAQHADLQCFSGFSATRFSCPGSWHLQQHVGIQQTIL
jgi:hypothetical protein